MLSIRRRKAAVAAESGAELAHRRGSCADREVVTRPVRCARDR